MKKRYLSMLMAVVLCLTLGAGALAADGEVETAAPVDVVEAVEAAAEEVVPAEEAAPEQTAVEKVQALINALPDADSITEENRADVEAQLTAIDEAKFLLEDELDALDFTKYNAAIAALNELDGMGGAEVPETLEDTLQGSGTEAEPWILTQDSFDNAGSESSPVENYKSYYYLLPSGNYKLGGDITLNKRIKIDAVNVTLDLNGKHLTGCGADAEAIEISYSGQTGGNLTLNDSSEAKTGAISNGYVYVDSYPCSFTMNGGTIRDANYGVRIQNDSTFTMTGGSITGCSTSIRNYGGTVTLPSGTTLDGKVETYGTFSFDGNTFEKDVQCGNKNWPIDGGTFLGVVKNGEYFGDQHRAGLITGGVFYEKVINYANGNHQNEYASEIRGGVFYNKVENQRYNQDGIDVKAKITGGVFLGGITGDGTIEGTQHKITVDLGNGGTLDGIVVGDTLYSLGEPPVTREGYKFVGWYKDAEFTEPWDFTTQNPVEEGNMAFYAKWVCAGHTGGMATCQAQATCETCGEEYGEVDSSNHVGGTETRNAKDATCTEDGYTGDIHCKGCDTKLQDGKPITKLGHIDADKNHVCDRENCKATLSTCSGGTATCEDKAVCDYCAKPYGEVDKSNHVGGTETRNAKDATCTEDGYTGDIHCKGCGDKLSDGKAIDKTGHDYESKVTKEATTTSTGTKTYTCKNCGHSYEEEIAKLPSQSTSPKTGDEANVMLWLALGLSAALTLGYVSVRKKEN